VKLKVTTEYDAALQAALPHLANYSRMLPYVGSKWKKSSNRVLVIGDSHYMPPERVPGKKTNTNKLTNLASVEAVSFYPERKLTKGFPNPLKYDSQAGLETIFLHCHDLVNYFESMAYYNYFQPQTFVTAKILKQYKHPHDMAFQTLKTITRILQPHTIVFIRWAAWTSFKNELAEDDDIGMLYDLVIDYTCHPGSIYWYNNVKSYGNQTGYAKFMGLCNNRERIPGK
jgi:serine/threonine protein kinase